MWQTTCGVVIRSVRNENGTGGSSPGCTSSPRQSIVVPSSRGGVPVFSRPSAKPSPRKVRDRPSDGASPTRPAGIFSSPIWIRPPRNVPVVSTTRPAPIRRPSPSATPQTRPGGVEQQILGRALDDVESRRISARIAAIALAVQLAVGLGARAAHRRPLAAVQHAELDAGPVDRAAHDAVERVDLAHQMPLGETRRSPGCTTFRRSSRAACVSSAVRAPEPRRRRRRLAPGMPAADHDDVVDAARFLHFHGAQI